MNKTGIEWADYTWNPVTGCTQVSQGCDNCYAKAMTKRFNKGNFDVTLHRSRLDDPREVLKPSRVFVCSMSDLFHKDVSDDFILEVLRKAVTTPWHVFMFLTKRPDRMQRIFNALPELSFQMAENIWLGVTLENQAEDWRVKALQQTKCKHRFISMEPMLNYIELLPEDGEINQDNLLDSIDWVIVGGETGPGARECKERWVRAVYNDCATENVPFYFKQTGRKWINEQANCYDSSKVHWLNKKMIPEAAVPKVAKL